MNVPPLELDERWFEVLARSDRAVLACHRQSGKLTIWRLDWREYADLPEGFTGEAWETFMKVSNDANN